MFIIVFRLCVPNIAVSFLLLLIEINFILVSDLNKVMRAGLQDYTSTLPMAYQCSKKALDIVHALHEIYDRLCHFLKRSKPFC
jgi:hypothetical protein